MHNDLTPELASPLRPRRVVKPGESGDDYDALAALFLEDGALAATARAAAGPAGTKTPTAITAPTAPEDNDEVTTYAFPGRSRDNADASAPRQPARATLLEALVVGHLPVLGAAWVGQYAKHAAAERGEPLVLVRVSHDQTSIDLVTPPGAQTESIEPWSTGKLDAAIAAAASRGQGWIIRVHETSEPDLYEAGVDRATLLTGADEAAVVASYRTIKSLSAGSRDGLPSLNIAIMGASDESAAAAESRLLRATETFLGQRVPAAMRIGRIGPARLVSLYRGQDLPSPADLVSRIRRSAGIAQSASDILTAPPRFNSEPAASRAFAPTRVESMRPATPEPIAEPKPRAVAHPAAGTSAAGVPGVSLAADAANAHRPLSRFVPSLGVLELTCPYASGVEFACDTDGVLHLLAASESSESALAVGQAVQRLLTAASWVADHAAILRRAFGALSAAQDPPETVLHLFTEEPRHARRLLDTGIRVHLLAHAMNSDGAAVWVHRELN